MIPFEKFFNNNESELHQYYRIEHFKDYQLLTKANVNISNSLILSFLGKNERKLTTKDLILDQFSSIDTNLSYFQRFFNISHYALIYLLPLYAWIILLLTLGFFEIFPLWITIITVLLTSATWNTTSMKPASDQWYTEFKINGYNIF